MNISNTYMYVFTLMWDIHSPTIHHLEWGKLRCTLLACAVCKQDCREMLIPVGLGVIHQLQECSLQSLVEPFSQTITLGMVCIRHPVFCPCKTKQLLVYRIDEFTSLV